MIISEEQFCIKESIEENRELKMYLPEKCLNCNQTQITCFQCKEANKNVDRV